MTDEELIQLARARYESGLAPSYEQTEAIFRAMDERDELRKLVAIGRQLRKRVAELEAALSAPEK